MLRKAYFDGLLAKISFLMTSFCHLDDVCLKLNNFIKIYKKKTTIFV